MSGRASAHLPIIIWLSSVAVFSAPLTHNPTKRRGKTAKLSSLQPSLFFVGSFSPSKDNNSIDCNSFPSEGVTRIFFFHQQKEFRCIGVCFLKKKKNDRVVGGCLLLWFFTADSDLILPWLHCRSSLIFFPHFGSPEKMSAAT